MRNQSEMPEVVVLSDLHLGSYGCHAPEIAAYLASIQPKILILNGDIIDIWRFKKRYFPEAHFQVLKELLKHLKQGTKVYYLTGNHDEAMRRFSGYGIGGLVIDNKLVMELDGKLHWFIHGDIFDLSMNYSKWLAKLGGAAYDWLIVANRFVNHCLNKFGKSPVSFSKRVKAGVKKAIRYISDFENMVIKSAVSRGVDVVCCGHIHQPKIEDVSHGETRLTYLNAGDWVESLTALEYENGKWNLFEYAGNSNTAEIYTMEDFPNCYSLEDLLLEVTACTEASNKDGFQMRY